MRDIILCGIDGTLSSDQHRRHLITPRRCLGCWHHSMATQKVCVLCNGTGYETKPDQAAYEAASLGDTPLQTTIDLIKHLTGNLHMQLREPKVWVVTGRNKSTHEQTVAWLAQNLALCDLMVMREDGDTTPQVALKQRWLRDGTIPRDRVFCVFDANDDCVKMWRDEGLTCYQTAPAPSNKT